MSLCEMKKGFLIIHIGDELDHHYVEILHKEIQDYQNQYFIKHMIFDFERTKFMDSSGVGMLLYYYKYQNNIHGNIYVVGVSAYLQKLFYVSGLHKIINYNLKLEDVLNEEK